MVTAHPSPPVRLSAFANDRPGGVGKNDGRVKGIAGGAVSKGGRMLRRSFLPEQVSRTWWQSLAPVGPLPGKAGGVVRSLGTVAREVGTGMLAAAIGTIVMMLCLRLQERFHHQPKSTSPARAISAVFGLQTVDDRAQARLALVGHWAYGTSLGALRGLMGALRVPWAIAGTIYFLVTWWAAMLMLPGLGVTEPLRQWRWWEITEEGVDHLLYAGATEAAYAYLHR